MSTIGTNAQPVTFGKFSGYLEEVKCPICTNPAEPEIIYRKREGVFIKRCPDCEIFYASPRFDEPSLHQIYENESFKDFSQYQNWSYEAWKAAKKRSWNVPNLKTQMVRRFVKKDGRILDVGCATGEFVLEATKQGLQCEGIDISQKMTEVARTVLGVKATCADLADFDPGYGFDGMVVWDVLEHVFDPVKIMKDCTRLLNPGGYLFAQVPNVQGISNRFKSFRCRMGLSKRDYAHFGFPYHLYFFGKKSLQKLAHAAGLEAVHFESWTHLHKNGVENPLVLGLSNLVKRACVSDYIILVARKPK
jgi:2-polyprenyl-3-methyl-5-hydroxy-6-metoxy-1,4-benzoquinol methylase